MMLVRRGSPGFCHVFRLQPVDDHAGGTLACHTLPNMVEYKKHSLEDIANG